MMGKQLARSYRNDLLLDIPEGNPRRRNDDPEHRDQTWAHKMLEIIVLQPRWIEAIDHASVKTDNQRSRFQAAGGVFGTQDHQLYQLQVRRSDGAWQIGDNFEGDADLIERGMSEGWCRLWAFRIEFKHGRNAADDRQLGVHRACAKIGIPTDICYGPMDAYLACKRRGFILHRNALGLAVEYQARADASHRAAKQKKPRQLGAPRQPAHSRAALAACRRTVWAK
jgi:hypothetical protein